MATNHTRESDKVADIHAQFNSKEELLSANTTGINAEEVLRVTFIFWGVCGSTLPLLGRQQEVLCLQKLKGVQRGVNKGNGKHLTSELWIIDCSGTASQPNSVSFCGCGRDLVYTQDLNSCAVTWLDCKSLWFLDGRGLILFFEVIEYSLSDLFVDWNPPKLHYTRLPEEKRVCCNHSPGLTQRSVAWLHKQRRSHFKLLLFMVKFLCKQGVETLHFLWYRWSAAARVGSMMRSVTIAGSKVAF